MVKKYKKDNPLRMQISVSMPLEIVQQLDGVAEKEQRTRSNCICYYLKRIFDGFDRKTHSIAEPKRDFKS